jgi:outer membrane protein TolC
MFKKTIFIILIFMLSFIFFPHDAGAKGKEKPKQTPKLTLEEVLGRSAASFPKIEKALQAQDEFKASITAAQGAFDTRIESRSYNRIDGFYSGDAIDTRVVQPLANYNAKVEAGYRYENGTFPIYENDLETNNRGEASLKLAFSVLRNRAIDEKRAKITNARFDYDQALIVTELTQLAVQQKAMETYVKWVASGQTWRVYEDLLAMALERQKNLEQRAKAGDVANIQVTENKQYIFERKALIEDAKREFLNNSNDLSLFYRDAGGNPITPTLAQVPASWKQGIGDKSYAKPDNMDAILARHPELQNVNMDIAKQRTEENLAKNSLLPQLDVGLKNARDFGDGSRTREGNETALIFDFSMPLQQRYATGSITKARAKLAQLETDKKLINNQIQIQVENLLNDLSAAQEIVSLSENEISLSKKMLEAEKTQLANGQSDFFRINMREGNIAKARINNLKARSNYFKSLAAFYTATLEFKTLGIISE